MFLKRTSGFKPANHYILIRRVLLLQIGNIKMTKTDVRHLRKCDLRVHDGESERSLYTGISL